MQEIDLTSNPLTYSQLEKAQQADSDIKKNSCYGQDFVPPQEFPWGRKIQNACMLQR